MKGIRKIEMIKKDKMTKEEAIKELTLNVYDGSDSKLAQALKMAISALEQEPCDDDRQKVITHAFTEGYMKGVKYTEEEYCDDAISRAYIEPIIEELENICVNADEYILNLLADIKNAPSVQPSRKGHWIDRSEGGRIKYPWMEAHECDKCGEYGSAAWNFCPNCGADMRGDT